MKTRTMTRCAIFAAAMAVCAWVSVPMGDMTMSLQTFGLFLTLGLLGGRSGSAALLVYMCLGALGAPVFSGFQGGLGHLLGPTGGYLWGFLAAGLIYWATENRLPRWLCMGLGMLACYICAAAWYWFVFAQTGLWAVILKCVVPYILPDAAKITLVWMLTPKLKRILER